MIDPELIKSCRNGNISSFRKLVDLSTPVVFRVAFRMLGDEDKAKDVVQDTMVTVWQKIDRIKSAEAYQTWIYRIAMNKCYDEMRKKKNNPEYGADDATWASIEEKVSAGADTSFENREIAVLINALTDRLSPKQKAAFILSVIEELSGDEVAAVTGMSKAHIKANLYYARKRISEMIEKYI